jgi:methylmalonyl-CoA mutase
LRKDRKGNLLEIAVDAARNRTTLGEISDALETVYGRYKAQIKSFSGFIKKEKKTIKVSKGKTNSGYLCKTGRTPP